jgi:arylsulfatase A-like enzyme
MRILYIDIDTLRADHLGCYGYHRDTSPNIDAIAKDGTIFSQCYASDVPCLPSRAALFTGRFGIHTGIVGHGGTAADMRLTGLDRGFDDARKSLHWPSILRGSQYYPVTITPYAERHSAYWFYAGWKEIYNPGMRGLEIVDQVYPYAEKWLNENAERDRWFLHINTWDPHTPYRTPMSFENPFEKDRAPSWITQDIINEHRKSYGWHSAKDLWGFGFPIEKRRSKHFPRAGITEIKNIADFNKWIDGYDVGIRYADEMVGKIVNILKEHNIYDDTLIIVSSDHGESQGELNVYGDHATACHVVNRIPMIVKWPGKKWKKEYDSLIYQFDIAATIIEGIGKKVPDSWDGKSFYKKIENNEKFGRDYLILSQNALSCQRTVRFDEWTLIRTYHTGFKNYPEIMLFNYKEDFHMTNNLAETRPDIVGRGLKMLDEWHKEMMRTSTTDVDPMWTVIKEGGPEHTRYDFNKYLKRLKKTDREHWIKKIKDKNESYLS